VEKPGRKWTLRSIRIRCKGNIKRGFREKEWVDMDWINLAQDSSEWKALMNMVMNLRVPQSVGTFVSNRATGCLSRRIQLLDVRYLTI
jgi:hypothetical protein